CERPQGSAIREVDALRRHSLLALLIGTACICRIAHSAELTVGEARIAQATSKVDSVVVIVDVRLQDASAPWAARMWGSDEDSGGARATRHVGNLRIRWAGSSVYVPLSAYSDLGNPESVEFVRGQRGATFVIHGGDTSTGYSALFFLDRGVLKRRRV